MQLEGYLGVMGNSGSQNVLLLPSLSQNNVLVAITTEALIHKDQLLEMEAGSSVLWWHS